MRVLFCSLDYAPSSAGGAEHQAQLQAESMTRRGHRVEVVCPRVRGLKSGAVNGIFVHRLPRVDRRPFKTLSYLFVLFGYLVLHLRSYDLVHVHLANLQADVAVAVARLLRRPSYLKIAAGGRRGEIGRLQRVAWLTRFYGIRHATVVQALSTEIADEVMRLGVPTDRVVRIPNGVVTPPALAPLERLEARAQLGLNPSNLIILFVGRLAKYKGIGDLLAVWNALPISLTATLLLVGDQADDQPADVSGLQRGVEWRKWTPNVTPYYAAADVFVLPSFVEGMSNALLEAMAAGLPPIVTRVGAAADMIIDGQNGLLINPGDRDALGSALMCLEADDKLRARMGAAARGTVIERFDIDFVMDAIEAVYRSACRTS